MSILLRHVLLPTLAPAAVVTISIGLRARLQGRSSIRWLISTLILTLPLVLVLGPLG